VGTVYYSTSYRLPTGRIGWDIWVGDWNWCKMQWLTQQFADTLWGYMHQWHNPNVWSSVHLWWALHTVSRVAK